MLQSLTSKKVAIERQKFTKIHDSGHKRFPLQNNINCMLESREIYLLACCQGNNEECLAT